MSGKIQVTEQDKRDMSRGVLKIPVAFLGVFIFMIGQTLGAVWWAATQNTKMDYIIKDQASLRVVVEHNTKDRYTGTEAKQDFAEQSKKSAQLETEIRILHDDFKDFKSRYAGYLERKTGH